MKIILLSIVLFSLNLQAQAPSAEVLDTATEISKIEVRAPAEPSEASRFPLLPSAEIPVSATQFQRGELEEARVQRLSEITRLEASASDSYNATGYWDFLNVRGFTLDNRGSYLREGLPINAETSLPLDNKKSVEILKGLSGMQVGASAPGGVVNFTVLRPPPQGRLNRVFTSVTDEGGWSLGAESGGRSEMTGYRALAAYEWLRPPVEHSQGHRYLLSYAQDFYVNEKTLAQFEVEHSKRSQPSQGGWSLFGTQIPSPRARVNLNNQAWVQPVVFSAVTGTAGIRYEVTSTSHLNFSVGLQDLVTDDRLAYAYGCSAENNFDRFCSDGRFDVYDFRSDNERRRTEAAKISWDLQMATGAVQHGLQVGALASRSRDRFNKQAYNYVGVGNIEGTAPLPEDPQLTDENTQRDSDTLDVFVFDTMKWHRWGLWVGARSSTLRRASVRTDGSRPTDYNKSFLLPWTALSYEFAESLAYVSYGEGIETFVTPNRTTYNNPGQFVDDVRSKQYELGLRHRDGKSWSAAVFEIHRPLVADAAPAYQVDGKALHRGVEFAGQKELARWTLGASAMLLDAKREDSQLQSALNGRRPVNVPKSSWRAWADYQWTDNGKIGARFIYEDDRAITSDNSLTLASWERWDLGTSYQIKSDAGLWDLRLFVENVLDKKFWQESPTQYGHIYFYPGQERTLSLEASYRF